MFAFMFTYINKKQMFAYVFKYELCVCECTSAYTWFLFYVVASFGSYGFYFAYSISRFLCGILFYVVFNVSQFLFTIK